MSIRNSAEKLLSAAGAGVIANIITDYGEKELVTRGVLQHPLIGENPFITHRRNEDVGTGDVAMALAFFGVLIFGGRKKRNKED